MSNNYWDIYNHGKISSMCSGLLPKFSQFSGDILFYSPNFMKIHP